MNQRYGLTNRLERATNRTRDIDKLQRWVTKTTRKERQSYKLIVDNFAINKVLKLFNPVR